MSCQETCVPPHQVGCVCVFACICVHVHICTHVCAVACTPKNACFDIPTYHAQLCVHESADVIVLMMIMMMVFIHLQRWKKVDVG